MCRYARNRRVWERRTSLGGGLGSWLAARARSPGNADFDWGVGCRACAWARATRKKAARVDPGSSSKEVFGTFGVRNLENLRLSNFRRHALSGAHKEAAKMYQLHCATAESTVGVGPCLDAPPLEEFRAVWLDVRKGTQRTERKGRTLERCLYEALRDTEVAFLGRAACVSLMLDERQGRLLIKHAASDRSLEVRWGVLAMMRDAGATAQDAAAAVHEAVRRICARRAVHPALRASRAAPRAHANAQEHIRSRIEMFTADGASNEQLAGRLLHPAALRRGAVEKLPALRLVLRDRAHATRRVAERTFAADALLDNIMQVMVTGPNSVARLLKNSRAFQVAFEAEVRRQVRPGSAAELRSSVRNMSFAKQRFDSNAKPLGRAALNLDALISTMALILRQRNRNSKEGQGAANFLKALSPRNVLLMGMMADDADECLLLTW